MAAVVAVRELASSMSSTFASAFLKLLHVTMGFVFGDPVAKIRVHPTRFRTFQRTFVLAISNLSCPIVTGGEWDIFEFRRTKDLTTCESLSTRNVGEQ